MPSVEQLLSSVNVQVCMLVYPYLMPFHCALNFNILTDCLPIAKLFPTISVVWNMAEIAFL
jgi:hypothetical protein